MEISEYASLDAVAMMELCGKGEVTPKELRECAIRSIEALNPDLNFLSGAILENSCFEHNAQFSGLPFLVKEGHGCKGLPAAQGSRLCKGILSKNDSEFILRLKSSGIDVLGATTAPEFGIYHVTESGLHGATRNPWDTNHTPGGSSGGTSSAVAAGVVPVASSSDGGGSIRTPAHCCGVFGLKPSRARTPTGNRIDAGLFPFGHFHVTTRTVRDSAAFLDITSGPVKGARYSVPNPGVNFLTALSKPLKRLKIGFNWDSPTSASLHPDCKEAMYIAVKLLTELGHELTEVPHQYDWNQLMDSFTPAWVHGLPLALSNLEKLTGRQCSIDTLDIMTLRINEYAKSVTVNDLLVADETFQVMRRELDIYFGNFDILLTPTALTPAPLIGEFDPNNSAEDALSFGRRSLEEFSCYTPLYNISGNPAASVPIFIDGRALPSSVQIASSLGDESTILQLAHEIETSRPWINRIPSLSARNL